MLSASHAMLAVTGITIGSFQIPLEVVVLGLIAGLTYSLLAIGLVLAYKASRVLNFAHGEMGALAAVLVPVLVINDGLGYWPSVLVALAVGAGTGVFMEYLVIRKFARSSRLIALVATIGASQLFFAIEAFMPKGNRLGSHVFPTPFSAHLSIGSLHLSSGDLLILIVAPVATALVAAWLRFTRVGLAARCSAENADAAALAGVPVRRVSLMIWTITGLLAAVAGILIGPTRPIVTQEALGADLLLRVLAAAMIGGLTSLSGAFFGGMAIGLVEAIVQWNYPTGGTLEVTLLVIIIVALVARRSLGARLRGGEASSWSLSGTLRALEPRLAQLLPVRRARRGGIGAALAVAVLLPLAANNSQRVLMSAVVLFAAMGLSLVVLTGFAGQVSLGQFAFVEIGALIGGRMLQLGYPIWMAVLYATAGGGIVALVIGIPALRVRGVFLAVVTLGFAVACQTWLYGQSWLVNVSGAATSLTIPRPHLLGIDFASELHYYWLAVAVFVVLAAVTHRIRVSGLGRSMMAVRDNELSAAAMGVSPWRVKLAAFVVAGAMAALAGYFYGGLLVNFPTTDAFSAELGLALVAIIIFGGITTITGAVLGALYLKGLAYVLEPVLPSLLGSAVAFLVGGVGLLAAVLAFPNGVVEVAFRFRDRIVGRLVSTPVPAAAAAGNGASQATLAPGDGVLRTESNFSGRNGRKTWTERNLGRIGTPVGVAAAGVATAGVATAGVEAGGPVLVAENLVARFGGNIAVDHVSLFADDGEIVGLVGPNGAGKTTLFDLLSGQLSPASGRVLLFGQDITHLRPDQRARLGLGRTFQQARLFDEMTLLDTLKVSLERSEPSEVVPSILGLAPSRQAERAKDLEAEGLLDLLGLGPFAQLHTNELSTGMRRLAELGCMVGLGATVLLLDEPTAGIAQREVEAFRPVLRAIREHLGATMIVVEHDIPLIASLVDRVYVLDTGQVLAEGPPRILREDPRVIAAYLGSDERMIQRSGSQLAGVR